MHHVRHVGRSLRINSLNKVSKMKQGRVALIGSITKWRKIVEGTGTDAGIKNCPLCKEFHDGEHHTDDLCERCPVKLHVNDFGCFNTPYADWYAHHRDEHVTDIEEKDLRVRSDCEACVELARKELAFLLEVYREGGFGITDKEVK